MGNIRIKDETGCLGCFFVAVLFWATMIVMVGGYKLFMWVLSL